MACVTQSKSPEMTTAEERGNGRSTIAPGTDEPPICWFLGKLREGGREALCAELTRDPVNVGFNRNLGSPFISGQSLYFLSFYVPFAAKSRQRPPRVLNHQEVGARGGDSPL